MRPQSLMHQGRPNTLVFVHTGGKSFFWPVCLIHGICFRAKPVMHCFGRREPFSAAFSRAIAGVKRFCVLSRVAFSLPFPAISIPLAIYFSVYGGIRTRKKGELNPIEQSLPTHSIAAEQAIFGHTRRHSLVHRSER